MSLSAHKSYKSQLNIIILWKETRTSKLIYVYVHAVAVVVSKLKILIRKSLPHINNDSFFVEI